MKRNQVNNQLDHPKDYYYCNVSYLRKCLWGNSWKYNDLILNIRKTKQITEYNINMENGGRGRRSLRISILSRQKVFVWQQFRAEGGWDDTQVVGLLGKSSFFSAWMVWDLHMVCCKARGVIDPKGEVEL